MKPLSKRSNRADEITESCRWWECSILDRGEWTYEGSPKGNE